MMSDVSRPQNVRSTSTQLCTATVLVLGTPVCTTALMLPGAIPAHHVNATVIAGHVGGRRLYAAIITPTQYH